MNRRMNRRGLLTGSGAVLAAAFAGCSTFADDEQEGVILTHVELGNATGKPQEFHLLVEYDGETIHQSTHEVEAGDGEREMGGKVVDIDAPPEPGIVEIHVEVEGQSRTLDFDSEFARREYGGERVIGIFTYGMRGDSDRRALTAATVLSDRPDSGNESQ